MAIGCTGHKVNADGNVAVEFNNTINPLAENISSIELIPLETDSEHLVGGVTDLTIAGDSYIVMDLINNNIFRYSADGKFLGRIGQKGNGPEEYIRINDIQYRDGNLCVFSTPSKLQRFSLDGNMIDSKIFPEMDLGSMSWLTDEGLLQRLAYGCDVLELLVPVLDVSHRDVLAERTLPKAKMIKYLSDMVPGDFISGLGKFAPDLCLADGDPSHGLILRKAGHVGLYDPDHRPQPFRMLGQRGVTASSVPADASFPERVAGMQFLQPFLKSVRADSHIFAKFAVAESSGLEAFRPRGKKQSSVPFIQTRHVSQLCWREYFWRRFRMHPYNSWLFYKDTKFSPDLLYYIIDNQIINLIFYAASPKRNQASFDSDSRGRNRHLMAA